MDTIAAVVPLEPAGADHYRWLLVGFLDGLTRLAAGSATEGTVDAACTEVKELFNDLLARVTVVGE